MRRSYREGCMPWGKGAVRWGEAGAAVRTLLGVVRCDGLGQGNLGAVHVPEPLLDMGAVHVPADACYQHRRACATT